MKDIKNIYNQINKLSYEEFASQFRDADWYLQNNNFDWTTVLYRHSKKEDQKKQIIKNIVDMSMDIFSSKNLEKVQEDKYLQNRQELQEMFFYYIQDFAEYTKNTDIIAECKAAEKDGSWLLASKQAELLNLIISYMGSFNNKVQFTEELLDFSAYKDGTFAASEAVTRLLYYFSNGFTKEDIILELNFIREQQKRILPCRPNFRKSNYTQDSAKKEIEEKEENLKKIRSFDKGFKINNYSQTILKNNQSLKMNFTRNLECKAFRETDLVWDAKPKFNSETQKIEAEKSERMANKCSLSTKYLYQERNVFTHSGESYSIKGLFNYRENKKNEWLTTVLQSLYDARSFLRKNGHQESSPVLLSMLDVYFKKTVSKVQIDTKTDDINELWQAVFSEEGNITLENELLKKTDINNVLDDDEKEQLKSLMKFIYCNSHEDKDFLTEYKFQIALYLTYISLNIAKIDSKKTSV